jgi:hypothetical protein
MSNTTCRAGSGLRRQLGKITALLGVRPLTYDKITGKTPPTRDPKLESANRFVRLRPVHGYSVTKHDLSRRSGLVAPKQSEGGCQRGYLGKTLRRQKGQNYDRRKVRNT